MISIIMPAYNSAKYINSAINSVLNQSYTDYELIIVDDCSQDNTYEIIKKKAAKDLRIRIYRNKKNIGVSKTRNHAIDMARGKWIAFLDSDDIWTYDKLEKQVMLIEKNPNAVLLYTGSAFIDENNNRYGYIMPVCERIDYKTLLKKNLISCSSTVVRKDVIEKEKMHGDEMHEDYVSWLNIVKKYGYAVGINEPLLIYRLSHNSKSANRLKAAKMSFNSYRHIGYSNIVAGLFVLRYTFYSIKKRGNILKSKGEYIMDKSFKSNKNSYINKSTETSLCATCQTGVDMLKLDDKEPMCPYICFHKGTECLEYKAMIKSQTNSNH